MKFLNLLSVLAASPALASYSRGIFRRDDTCNIQLASSNGNRKVAIVIDSSGSMSSNDPLDLRIDAGKGLNKQLIAGSDQVSVIDFDNSATVLYALSDPAGAESSFDQINSSGGTDITEGVETAITELTSAGSGDTAGRSGIVVLTDGEDSSVSSLIAQINNAASLGIRVSFGFLAPDTDFFEPDLLSAILKTGGSYTSFNSADAIQSFLFLVLSNGLVANDVSSGTEQPLLPGITVAKLSGADPITFGYEAQDGEDLQFTISSLSNQELSAELQDSAGSSIASNTTAAGPAVIDYSAGAGALKLVVAATNDTSEGVFQVTLNSSLGIAGCNLNNTKPPTNTTIIPSSTPSPTQVVVSAAGRVAEVGFAVVGIAAAAMLL